MLSYLGSLQLLQLAQRHALQSTTELAIGNSSLVNVSQYLYFLRIDILEQLEFQHFI